MSGFRFARIHASVVLAALTVAICLAARACRGYGGFGNSGGSELGERCVLGFQSIAQVSTIYGQ